MKEVFAQAKARQVSLASWHADICAHRRLPFMEGLQVHLRKCLLGNENHCTIRPSK